jgi:hypothetical protein
MLSIGEVDGVRDDLDCVSDAVKSEEFRVSVENIAEGASLFLIEEQESHDGKENVAAVDSAMVLDGLSGTFHSASNYEYERLMFHLI